MNKQAYYLYKSANLTKLALNPIYTEEEFNRKVDEYRRNKRGDIPEATTYNDMFNKQLDNRQQELDDINRSLSKAVWRANGPSPYITGAAGVGGAWLGGHLANLLFGSWHKPRREEYADEAAYLAADNKYKDGFWSRLLGGTALRAGGFLLGGALPYILSRTGEGVYDGVSYGVRSANRALNNRTKRGPVSGDPIDSSGGHR